MGIAKFLTSQGRFVTGFHSNNRVHSTIGSSQFPNKGTNAQRVVNLEAFRGEGCRVTS